MVIGLRIGSYTGGRIRPPALPDSEKPGLFRVKERKAVLCHTSVVISVHKNSIEYSFARFEQFFEVSSQSRKFEFNVLGIIHLNGHNF